MSSVFPPEDNRITHIHRTYKRMELVNREYLSKNRSKKKWKTIYFKNKVNLIEKPDETLKYFNSAHKLYHQGYNVEYDFSNVTHFSPESIAIFAACLANKSFTNYKNSKGNSPVSRSVASAFEESGFFDHVTRVGAKKVINSKPFAKLLHKVTDNKVETDTASNTCKYVFSKIDLPFIDDLEPLYVVLVEAMQNTNNHASANQSVEYDWWLNRYEEKSKKLIHFTFLDIGVGVFESLSVMDWKKKIIKSVNLTSNLDLVDDLLAGRIRSRTLRKDRGKGVPQIYDSSKDSLFNDFYIFSNDVMINTKTDERLKLKNQFHGTLYYWTIKIK
jgi:hypothetical protein